jgi:hypothetical protein
MESSKPDLPEKITSQPVVASRSPSLGKRWSPTGLQALLWVSLIALIIGLGYIFWPEPAPQPLVEASSLVSPTEPNLPPTATPTALRSTVTSAAATGLPTPPTLPSDAVSFSLTPAAEAVGWVSSLDGRSHFGLPNIHAGVFQARVYYGALQFDLSAVPPGSTIIYAAVDLVGLDEQNLGSAGNWRLNLLDPAIDPIWPKLTYESLRQAPVETALKPVLSPLNLDQGQVNRFQFDPRQLSTLQQHLTEGVISFRLEGPIAGGDNMFTWDSGYRGEKTLSTIPTLRLVAIPPLAPEYVIVTSTPTPENLITVAAMAATATKVAAATGTYTPVPAYWVTPVVVVSQPTPANTATAAHQAALTTAEAFLFGTATPTPLNVWTATSTPSYVAVMGTPIPADNLSNSRPSGSDDLAPNYIIVTSTPTPENLITVAAMAAEATEVATTIGTYTPAPTNWVTPIVVTPQPTPANTATAAHQAALATAEAFLFGPATPTPPNVWTVTPTPIFIPLEGELATPWVAFTPTPTPQPIPSVLVGKIAFLSNRSGGPEPLKEPLVYMVDPDGNNLAVLTDRAIYDAAVARDSYSADQRFRVFVKNALRFDGKKIPALYFYDDLYEMEDQVTHLGAGIAYDPVWSPSREQIAFVSNDSGNDEIWVIQRDGSEAQQLTRDPYGWWDKHPSWSPDGTQLVFWSNRTGKRQIWVMNEDGSNLYSLSRTGYDDWDPVWIKYTDPAPNPINHSFK